MTNENIGIVGAGNSARALAAHFAAEGRTVTMCARRPEALADIAERGGIQATGLIEGFFPLARPARSWRELAERNQTIFIATITWAYRDVARALAPHLTRDHRLILFSGKLGGALEVERELEAAGAELPLVIETDSLYAARAQADGSVWLRGFKRWTLYSCTQRSKTLEFGRLIERYFPGLEPASNLIERGVTDFGAHAHAVITMANLSKIDRKEPFLFYYEGLSEVTVRLLEAVEAEIKAVAHAYGATVVPMATLLDRYYGCDPSSLLTAMRTVPNYRHSVGPDTLNHRYLKEDVACSLLPLQELARRADVPTPMVDAVVTIATTLVGDEIQAYRRTLAGFGWANMTRGEITAWLKS